MQFPTQLIAGTLIKRYKRFLADVILESGEVVTAHCPNTGAMTHCQGQGWPVWLSKSDNPKRKLGYTWELVQNHGGDWIGINTQRANNVIYEALCEQKLATFTGYSTIRKEVKFGTENSRVDLLLQADNLADCYLEVKSVTLLENDIGYFPDTQTVRGQKHLRELMSVVSAGHRAAIVFCVQHTGIKRVSVANHIDPKYASLFIQAIEFGVECLAIGCEIDQFGVTGGVEIPIIFEN